MEMERTNLSQIPRDERRSRLPHDMKEDDDDDAAIAVADLRMEDCPTDLVLEIFKRSSVRSLLRLGSVCKEWDNTITSFDFKRNHYNYNSHKGRLLVYCRGSSKQRRRGLNIGELDFSCLALFRDETLEQYDELDHSLLAEGPLEIHTMLGPCNGVFFVADYHNDRIRLSLWNISTTKFRELSSPPEFDDIDKFGFGMDPLTDEFKIVLIRTSHFSIYTSSNDSWRTFESGPLLKDCHLQTSRGCGTTFLQPYFYWRNRNSKTYTSVILAFDMCSEVFKEIELPSEMREVVFFDNMFDEYGAVIIGDWEFYFASHQALLHVFEDALALICFEYDSWVHEGKKVDIWLMKEQGSWTKLSCKPLDFKGYRLLGFYMGKSIIFSTKGNADNEELVLHDPNSGNVSFVSFPAEEDVGCRDLYIYSYKESLSSV